MNVHLIPIVALPKLRQSTKAIIKSSILYAQHS